MKKIFAIVFTLLASLQVQAQFSAVTATIVDATSQAWSNSQCRFTFNPSPAYPSITQYNINGTPINSPIYSSYLDQQCTTNGSGQLTITVLDNHLISPSGSTWRIQVKPNASVPATVYSPVAITGATVNLSSFLSTNATPISFPAIGINSYGYSDSEVNPIPLPGGYYWNVSMLNYRYWNGTIWQSPSTGGGGGGGLTNYFDITSTTYGAVCDGTTDDYAHITAAIAAADSANGTVFIPPGKICAVSQTVIFDNCNLTATNAKLVPTGGSTPVDITPLQLGSKTGVNDPLYGLEPTSNHTYFQPDVYRPKPNPGWSTTTHPGVEIVSPNDNLYFMGRVTNFAIGTEFTDYGISAFTPPYGFGGSYSTVIQGWMENDKQAIVEAAQCNQCYINQINWIGGRANLNTSERSIAPFYGIIKAKSAWTAGILPNVITSVTANSDGSGGFPSALATGMEVVGGITGYPSPTLPDQAYVLSTNSGANTVTLAFNLNGFTTSGSNQITGVYNTKDLVGENNGTLISIPYVPINATYTVTGGVVSMSGNSQGTTVTGTLNHFTFYNNQTVIAKASGTLTAGSAVVSNLIFTSGNLAALGTGGSTSYITSYDAYVIPNGSSALTTPTSVNVSSSQAAVNSCSACQAQFINGTVALSNSAAYTGLPTIYTVNVTAGSSTVSITNSALTGNSWDGILGATTTGLESLITGAGIPSNTHVQFINDTHSFSITNNATATSSSSGTTLTFPAYANFNSTDLTGFTNTEFVVPVTGSAAISQLFYPDPLSFSNNNSFFQGISLEGNYWDYMWDCLGCSRNRLMQPRLEADAPRVRFRDYVPVTHNLPTWVSGTSYSYSTQVGYLGAFYECYLVTCSGTTNPQVGTNAWALMSPQYAAYENLLDNGFAAQFLQVITGPASSSNNVHTSQSYTEQLAKANGNVLSNQTSDSNPIFTFLSGQINPYDQNLNTSWTGHIGSRYWEGKVSTDTYPRFRVDILNGAIYLGDGKTVINSGSGNFSALVEPPGTPDAGVLSAYYNYGNFGLSGCVISTGCTSDLGYNYSHLVLGSTHIWYDPIIGAMKESTGSSSATSPGIYGPTYQGATPSVSTPGFALGASASFVQDIPVTTTYPQASGHVGGQGLIYQTTGQLDWDFPWAKAANLSAYLSAGFTYTQNVSLTSASASVGSNVTYTGIVPGGGSNGLAGATVTITGFANPSNNVTAQAVISSTATTLVVYNTTSAAESGATATGVVTVTLAPATNCGTSSYVYSPATNSCVANGTGGGGNTIVINSNASTTLGLTFATGAGGCSFSSGTTTCNFTGAGTGAGINQLTGDVIAGPGSGSAGATVKGINGVLLGSLASGLYYNTTSTGVPSIATSPQIVTTLNTSPSSTLAPTLLPQASSSAFGVVKCGTNTTCTGGVISVATGLQKICSGTYSLGTPTINAGSKTYFTITCTGATTSDNPQVDFNGATDPTTITGFGFTSTDGLKIFKWTTTDTINIAVGNPTTAPITMGATTVNFELIK